jgi:hypothetical protein
LSSLLTVNVPTAAIAVTFAAAAVAHRCQPFRRSHRQHPRRHHCCHRFRYPHHHCGLAAPAVSAVVIVVSAVFAIAVTAAVTILVAVAVAAATTIAATAAMVDCYVFSPPRSIWMEPVEGGITHDHINAHH